MSWHATLTANGATFVATFEVPGSPPEHHQSNDLMSALQFLQSKVFPEPSKPW